jgi:hypothetical protein
LSNPHVSTFLSPFAPRPLRRFSARMGTLTPRQVSYPTEVSPLHATRRSRPFCLQSPDAPHRHFHTLPLSSMGLPLRGQGFTFSSQTRRLRQAESSSSSCGLVSHLRLLSTPPLGDAVTFGFQAGERMPGEDLHLYTCALAGARAWGGSPRYRIPPQPSSPEGAAEVRIAKVCCRPFRAWGVKGLVFLGLTPPGYMLSPPSGLRKTGTVIL